jgi:hypothetical protein
LDNNGRRTIIEENGRGIEGRGKGGIEGRGKGGINVIAGLGEIKIKNQRMHFEDILKLVAPAIKYLQVYHSQPK